MALMIGVSVGSAIEPRDQETVQFHAEGYWERVWRRFRRHRLAVIASLSLIVLILACIVGPWISPYQYDEFSLRDKLQAPSRAHWLGTDDLGRDVLTRILVGGRTSFRVGLSAPIVATVIGLAVGLASAYLGGKWDSLMMRIVDFMMSLPSLPLLIVASQFFGGGIMNVVLILAVFGWMGLARLIRGNTLSLKNQDFTLAARSIGASDTRIMIKHLLPNVMAPVIVSVTLSTGGAIIAESSLSYLGLGVLPPTPTWGNMLSNAQSVMRSAPWMAIAPGLLIFVTLVCVNFMGDGLRDALDPQSRL